MKRVALPGGAWAEIREQKDLRARHRSQIRGALTGAMSAIAKLPSNLADLPDDPEARAAALAAIDVDEFTSNGVLTYDDAMALQRIQDVAIVTFLVAWSLPEPLPTLDTVGDMQIDIYDAIATATQTGAVSLLVGVDFAPPDPRKEVASDNPTGPPNDSNGNSVDEGGVPSLLPSLTDTSSSSSEG